MSASGCLLEIAKAWMTVLSTAHQEAVQKELLMGWLLGYIRVEMKVATRAGKLGKLSERQMAAWKAVMKAWRWVVLKA